MRRTHLLAFCLLLVFGASCSRGPSMNPSGNDKPAGSSAAPPVWLKQAAAKLEKELVAGYGEAQRTRVQRG